MRFLAAVAVMALLAMSTWAADEKVSDKAADKKADTPAPPANEWHGTVGCAKCDYADQTSATECLPSVKTADGVYLLKPAASAPPAVKEFLDRIQNKEMIGDYLIKGEKTEQDGKKWVAVTSMVAKPLDKPTAQLSLNRKRDKKTGAGGAGGADGGGADQGGGGGDEGGGGGGGRRGRGRRHGGGGDGGGEEGQ
jgi:hypothetical protein